ncbi:MULTISPECIES: diacylglycerol kinase family protein [unclassified Archaeoglobus]|uniref:diacylglycerol kinase family protein n=1 Tax=unclassified Archaeoglobus TaxID=2643606 RepID=UPI0025BE1A28|nr:MULTISPECIES: diacylglycerol kinase family protein [unclassified Archaeoglobus]
MRLGLVVNPLAGGGLNGEKIELIRNTLKKLSGEVYTSKTIAKTVGVEARVVDLPTKGTREDTLNLVRKLDPIVDLIVIFGGDGTMSDAASARPKKPLLCIGIGTTNVSPVLAPKDFDPKNLREVKMRGLEVVIGDEKRIAFNDVVVGSTILSTVGGRSVQVDAREFMKGKKVVTPPRKFKARVEVGGRIIEGFFGNIFVALSDTRFLGKGIAGGASLSAFLGFKAVVACISEGIVVSTYTKEDVMQLEPIVTNTISFDDEIVRIWANEVISCDGNPIGEGYAEVRVVESAVKVLK